MSFTRKYSRTQLCVDIHRYSLSPYGCCRIARKGYDTGQVHDTSNKLIRPLKCVRFYSSEGNSLKAQAPIGQVDEAQTSLLKRPLGESFMRLSAHINAYFKKDLVGNTNHLERASKRRHVREETQKETSKLQLFQISRRRRQKPSVMSEETKADLAREESHHPSTSWEESYHYLTSHINKYFHHKLRGQNKIESPPATAKNPSQVQADTYSTSGTPNLFHSSPNTTNFGENHLQMSGHINQYFKDCLRHPTTAIPDLNPCSEVKPPAKMTLDKKYIGNRRQSEELICVLVNSLRLASSSDAVLSCVEALNEQLNRYPSCKALMWQEKSAAVLLKRRRDYRDDPNLQSAIRESLALIGYVDPVKGHGIRVLSIDGGGTRGLVPLQLLKILEAETGKKVHQLFDYICGVSTGAVLAFMLGLAHFSLDECADMYRRFGSEVFQQNRLVGTMKMGWNHSYYNSETWETILREKLGERVLIKTARDELSPKVSAVSAVVNWGSSPKAFVFCNYNHKPGSLSRYPGGSGYPMWQAVRASSAAPGYFQEFTLKSDIHQDGGILMNNPCALAVHESRLLWPRQPFQCVLSLGTGRYDNAKRSSATSTSLRAKISNLICSATDTEGVHTLLDDLLAPDVYFRFNPMMRAQVSLDESRPEVLDQLREDSYSYLERNRPKLARLCLVLAAERSAVSRTRDWVNERAWEMKQRWV